MYITLQIIAIILLVIWWYVAIYDFYKSKKYLEIFMILAYILMMFYLIIY